MNKNFKIPGNEIKKLVSDMGRCMATDRVTVEGSSIGYMYREQSREAGDSGWCFFAGDESEDYLENPENIAVYDVNTLANYDKDIIPLLGTPAPCAFEKIKGSAKYKPV